MRCLKVMHDCAESKRTSAVDVPISPPRISKYRTIIINEIKYLENLKIIKYLKKAKENKCILLFKDLF